jgi:hypothetical protein
VKSLMSFQNIFDLLVALVAVVGLLAVLHSFVIGRHYIIPTTQLVAVLALGNLAWYGLQGQRWAKYLLFWGGVVLTCHLFFALFWSVAYRTLLGAAFEVICVLLMLLAGWLTWQYQRRNHLFP